MSGTCFACAHFCDDPLRIEEELPGLAILCSAHASVRSSDGLCLHRGVVANARGCCEDFVARR
jgi:hypothetical protein